MNLSSIFFAPNYGEMLPLFIEMSKTFKFSLDINPHSLVMRIISKYFEEYNREELAKPDNFGRMQGDFNLKLMLENAEIFCKNLRLKEMFKSPNSFLSPSKQREFLNSYIELDKTNTFALCTSKNALSISNNDAFATAGGSQYFESTENCEVYLSLNPYHGIFILVPMWLTYENYNNNFAGVKLSGGESKYEKTGEPTLKAIKTDSHDFLQVIEKYGLTLDKISFDNGISILKDYQF